MIVGVQGVQGSGKSTLCAAACARNPSWRCISLDDFYRTDEELQALHRTSKEPLWDGRGNPGTHDTSALIHALDEFRAGRDVEVPVYDKTCHDGRGDRVGVRTLRHGTVLLVEGWCVGFRADRGTDAVNVALRKYERIWKRMHALLILCPPSVDVTYRWRWESEQRLSEAELRTFVDRYMPAYDRYLSALHRSPPVVPCLLVQQDEERRPVRCTTRTSLPYPSFSRILSLSSSRSGDTSSLLREIVTYVATRT